MLDTLSVGHSLGLQIFLHKQHVEFSHRRVQLCRQSTNICTIFNLKLIHLIFMFPHVEKATIIETFRACKRTRLTEHKDTQSVPHILSFFVSV